MWTGQCDKEGCADKCVVNWIHAREQFGLYDAMVEKSTDATTCAELSMYIFDLESQGASRRLQVLSDLATCEYVISDPLLISS